jgi:hypothetical protein
MFEDRNTTRRTRWHVRRSEYDGDGAVCIRKDMPRRSEYFRDLNTAGPMLKVYAMMCIEIGIQQRPQRRGIWRFSFASRTTYMHAAKLALDRSINLLHGTMTPLRQWTYIRVIAGVHVLAWTRILRLLYYWIMAAATETLTKIDSQFSFFPDLLRIGKYNWSDGALWIKARHKKLEVMHAWHGAKDT